MSESDNGDILANAFASHHLYARALIQWKEFVQHRRALAKRNIQAFSLVYRSTTKRVLSRWKAFIQQKVDRHAKLMKAAVLAGRVLMRRAFLRLKSLKHVKEQRFLFRQKCVLQGARALMRFYIGAWKRYTSYCLQVKGAGQAVAHMVPLWQKRRAMKAMRLLFNEGVMMVAARDYCNLLFLRHGFTNWRLAYEWRVTQRNDERALRFYFERTRQRSFLIWKQFTVDRRPKRMLQEKAAAHFSTVAQAKAFSLWKLYVQSQRIKHGKQHKADVLRSITLFRKGWMVFQQRRETKQSYSLARQLYNKNLSLRVLSAWFMVIGLLKHRRSCARLVMRTTAARVAKETMAIWHMLTLQSRALKVRLGEARDHYHSVLLLRVVREWQRAAFMKRLSRDQRNNKLIDARVALQTLRRKQAFEAWRDHHRLKQLRKLRMARTRVRLAEQQMSRVLVALSDYTASRIIKKQRNERAKTFLERLILVRALKEWSYRFASRMFEKRATAMAYQHWKLTVYKQAFSAWKEYHTNKAAKKQMYEDAMRARREFLQKEVCVHWLKAGLEMKKKRFEEAVAVQTQRTVRIMHVVQRCALKWKFLASRKRRKQEAALRAKYASDTSSKLPVDAFSSHDAYRVFPRSFKQSNELPKPTAADLPPVFPQQPSIYNTVIGPAALTRRQPRRPSDLTYPIPESPRSQILPSRTHEIEFPRYDLLSSRQASRSSSPTSPSHNLAPPLRAAPPSIPHSDPQLSQPAVSPEPTAKPPTVQQPPPLPTRSTPHTDIDLEAEVSEEEISRMFTVFRRFDVLKKRVAKLKKTIAMYSETDNSDSARQILVSDLQEAEFERLKLRPEVVRIAERLRELGVSVE